MAEEIANRLLKKQTLCAELLVTYRTLECGSLLPTSFEMGVSVADHCMGQVN